MEHFDKNVFSCINNFSIEGKGICDLPNPEINKLNRKIELLLFPLEQRKLLLKGIKLRNAEWILGIIIYAKHNTKLIKKAKKPKIK